MFDLEEAIKNWRKGLNANEALEDGDKEELESHLRDKIEFLVLQGSSEKEAFEEAADIGIAKGQMASYVPNSEGLIGSCNYMSATVGCTRTGSSRESVQYLDEVKKDLGKRKLLITGDSPTEESKEENEEGEA